jgi:hypothetical protein
MHRDMGCEVTERLTLCRWNIYHALVYFLYIFLEEHNSRDKVMCEVIDMKPKINM